jgi:hypothetical protein
MAMAPNTFIYDTNTLIQVVPNLKLAQSFLLDKFFPNIVTADSEFVSIDVDVGKRRMAPFVSPLVEGKLVEQRRYQTNTFKPAYIKDKRAPDLRKPIRRMIGERIGGDMNAQDRAMANLESEMVDQIDILTRRLEWMAAQALLTATVTIKGDGFPTSLIDFGRDPLLTVALSGANAWGYTAGFNVGGRDPIPALSIETWQRQILKSSGASATDIIFTSTPWLKFLNAEGVQGAIYYPKLSDAGNRLSIGPEIQSGAVYKGRWGQYDLWLYNDWYVDEDTNVEKPMMPDGTVIMSGPMMQGTRAFGQIIDPAFNYASLPFAPKTWYEQDPPQQLLMMQSSPIVIPSRVNAAMAATVCAAVFT